MRDSVRNTLVGFFVLLSLVAVGILMVWFGETPSFLRRSEWTLRIVDVRNLAGIGEGSPVRLNGVEIGRVSSLQFEDPTRPERVIILTGIKRQYSIPEGSIARVFGATFGFGTGHVEIIVPHEPTTGQAMPRKDAAIRGEMRSLFGEIVRKDTIEQFERAVRNVADLTESWTPVGSNLSYLLERRPVSDVSAPGAAERGITPNLSTAVERFDQLVANLNVVLGDGNVQEDVKAAVRELRDSTQHLRDLIANWEQQTQRTADNLNTGIDNLESNLDRSFATLNTALEDLSTSARHLSNVTHGISQGRGSAGLLVRDDRLYEAAVLALQRVADAAGSAYRLIQKFEQDGAVTLRLPSGLSKRFEIPESPDASVAAQTAAAQ